MATETKDTKPRVSYPYKGIADVSWLVCPNCQGHGAITKELAIAGAAGAKGDTCTVCNGAGRVPDAKWPRCPEECGGDPECVACGGLGQLSPERRRALDAGEIRVPCDHCQGAGAVPYTSGSASRSRSRSR